jgi:hypothetical protein
MDVAKNILLILSDTPNQAPRNYKQQGALAKRLAKDQGHRNLCLLRTKEIETGRNITLDDLNDEMQQ